MLLSTRPLAAPPGTLRLWVGVFGVIPPNPFPLPTFTIGGVPTQPDAPQPMLEVRDKYKTGSGTPLNYYGVFNFKVKKEKARKRQVIRIDLLGQFTEIEAKPLPDSIDDGFTLLLSSCYCHESDAGAAADLTKFLIDWPDLVMLVGDQVYVDMPLIEDIPSSQPQLSQMLGDKYAKNFQAADLAQPSLYHLLKLAPTACIPDDHELWNNYPQPAAWVEDSRTTSGRARLVPALRELYEDYQLGARGAVGAQRFDVGPVHMLLVDARFDRMQPPDLDSRIPGGNANDLFPATTARALSDWKVSLLDAHHDGKLVIGVLACGQILLDQMAGGLAGKFDNNLQSFRQFGFIAAELRQLADAGVPVLYLSGDVHFSRVSAATYMETGHQCLFEVICSPSSLLAPLHPISTAAMPSTPKPAPPSFNANRYTTDYSHLLEGNKVAALNFRKEGTGVKVTVTYYSLARSRTPNVTISFDMVPRF